jgi:predicted AAA+ superfamily ATPase
MKSEKYDRYLGENEIDEYVKSESLSEKFETIYNTFVESDIESFKSQINKLSSNDFSKFMIHILGEMRVDPREVVRTLQSIVD